ncbi:hypothetical protein Hanom_Chr04g00328841 [Helianthus anomalus]
MSDHEHDDSDTEFIYIDIAGSYGWVDMKVENFILVLVQSELMSDHEPDDSDTEFIDSDISGSYGWIVISDGDIGLFSD